MPLKAVFWTEILIIVVFNFSKINYYNYIHNINIHVSILTINYYFNINVNEYQNFNNSDTYFVKKLQNTFAIIIPVHKAANNYAMICKKFYIEKIETELSVS